MKVTHLAIPEVMIIEPQVMGDSRGFFLESFNVRSYRDAIRPDLDFVQDNHSRSAKNVLRGLHYQISPMAQGKLVRVSIGAVYDVAVDIRRGSPTFGQWVGETLSADNKKQMWVPEGFAHGFLTLSDSADVLYKVTQYYAPELERSIAWNDPAIGIKWPLDGQLPILSQRDQNGRALSEA
ncbi:MAG: dTDP-4-dehydrorhamnose 3,5-epimerase [Pseudomonadota bacterium]